MSIAVPVPPALYALSLLVVFLCLAALYESWSVPFSVMLVVPLGVIGALLATWMRGLENDVYFQVGLLTVIGLSAKNAILINHSVKESHNKKAACKAAFFISTCYSGLSFSGKRRRTSTKNSGTK